MNTFDKIISRLREEMGVETSLELRKRLGINKTTWSTWKRRGSIPSGSIVECWEEHKKDFDLSYVISGERYHQRSAERLKDANAALDRWKSKYVHLKKNYAYARLLLEERFDRKMVDEIFVKEPQLPKEPVEFVSTSDLTHPQPANDIEPEKEK